MDVRDKLLFEPEYAGNLKEKIPPKSSLRIPWSWLPGALCLLQEVHLACILINNGCILKSLCFLEIFDFYIPTFCSDWRIKVCAGHRKKESSASRCKAVCR